MKSYQDEQNRRSALRTSLGLGAIGLGIYYRKPLATAFVGQLEKFIKSEVGDLTAGVLGAEERQFRPATRIAEEVADTIRKITFRERTSATARAFYESEELHAFRTNFGVDNLKKATGLYTSVNRESNGLHYRDAFSFIKSEDPNHLHQVFTNRAKKSQFQEAVEYRARNLDRGNLQAEYIAQAQQELAVALEHAHRVGASQKIEAAHLHKQFLEHFESAYLDRNQGHSFTDLLLSQVGVKRRTLGSDVSFNKAKQILAEGNLQGRGVFDGVLNQTEQAQFLNKLGNISSSTLLTTGAGDVDLSGLSAAISSRYNKLRGSVQLPVAPGLGGMTPFSFFPQFRGQSPKIIHELDPFAKLPFLSHITGENPGESPLGTLFVIGQKTSPFRFSGKGVFIGGDPLGNVNQDLQDIANQKMSGISLDIRDAKAGFLRTVNERASRFLDKKIALRHGFDYSEGDYDQRSIIGKALDSAINRGNQKGLNTNFLSTLRNTESKITKFLFPGGQGEDSLFQKAASVFGKYDNPEYVVNIYRERILKGDFVDPSAMESVFRTLKTRAGYINPVDFSRLIKNNPDGLFTTASQEYMDLMTKTNPEGHSLFLDDKEVLSFFSNHDIDLSTVKSQELKQAMRSFRSAPESAFGYGRNNDPYSILDDANLNFKKGILGQENKTQGVDHLKELLISELALHGEGTGASLIDRLHAAGSNVISSKDKSRYLGFLYGNKYSHILNKENVDDAWTAFRGSDSSLRSVTEEFFNTRLSAVSSFTKGPGSYPGTHYMVMENSPGLSENYFKRIRKGLFTDLDSFKAVFKDEAIEFFHGSMDSGYAEGLKAYNSFLRMLGKGQTFESRKEEAISLYNKFTDNAFSKRIKSFGSGLNKPEHFNGDSLSPYFLASRLNDQFLTPIGLGLGQDDLRSTSSIIFSLMFKRVLPVMGALRAIDYLEYRAHEDGRDAPDNLAANFRANMTLKTARFADRTGLTSFKKRLAQLTPGSKEFFDYRPMSESEYKEYLDHGRDPVRKGRGWLFGSRTPYAGEGISHFEANYYIRAKSDHESLSGGRKSAESFSLDPYALEKSQSIGPYAPRPYPMTGPLVDPHLPFSAIINNTIGRIIKPQKLINEDEFQKAYQEDLNKQGSGYSSGGYDSSGGGGSSSGSTRGSSERGRLSGAVSKAREFYENRKIEKQFGRSITLPYDEEPTSVVVIGSGGTMEPVSMPGGAVPAPYMKRYMGKAEPGFSLSKEQIKRLNKRLAAVGQGLTRIPRKGQDTGPINLIDPRSLQNQLNLTKYQSQQMAGVYGFMAGQLPGQDVGSPNPQSIIADSSMAFGMESRYWDANRGGSFLGIAGMGIDQPLNEFTRRIIPHRRRTLEAYNPLDNQYAGSEWLPGDDYFINFQKGDPMGSIPNGRMRLPGPAYRALWRNEIMQLRASSAGKTEDELVNSMLNKREPLSSYGEEVTQLGTALHKKVEAMFKRTGMSVQTEVAVADKNLGIKGSIDMIVKTGRGYEIMDLKTVGQEKFDKVVKTNRPLEEHLRQLTIYEHITGIKKGRLIYASRDSGQVYDVASDYNPERFKDIMNTVERARTRVTNMLENREISEADLYDNVTRYEILSDVAPYSAERKALEKSLAHDDQVSAEGKRRIKAAKERASEQRKKSNLFQYQFLGINRRLQNKSFIIESIEDGNTFYVKGSDHPIKLAGGSVSTERISKYLKSKGMVTPEGMTDAEFFYQKLGIYPGKRVSGLTETDDDLAFRNDTLQTRRVVLGNLNRRLIDMGVMEENEEDNTPTGTKVRFSNKEQAFGAMYERISHLDNPVNNKFLRVRSPLEAYQREIVYGTKEGSWSSPYKTYIAPTISAIASKDPFSAALLGGVVTTLPFVLKKDKLKYGAVGAGVAAGISLTRIMYENLSGKKFIPPNLKRRREVEEYFDILTYIKERNLFEQKAEEAKKNEGVDIKAIISKYENLSNYRKGIRKELMAEKRKILKERKKNTEAKERLTLINQELSKSYDPLAALVLGPAATEAIQHRNRYRRTMYGATPGSPLMDIMSSMAKNEREILTEALKSSDPEKSKLYNLLSDPQKRLLGLHLGKRSDELPDRPLLNEYFKKHQLPDEDSPIWDENVSIDDLKVRAYNEESFNKIELGIYPQVVAKAEERTVGVPVPYPNGRTRDIKHKLNKILSGDITRHVKHDRHIERPGGSWQEDNEITVNNHIRHDRRKEIFDVINERY